MSLSSFCVVTNALRLNLLKLPKAYGESEKNNNQALVENVKIDATDLKEMPGDNEQDLKNKNNNTKKMEDNVMVQELKIEGMMCPHCKAHVEKALGGMEGVTKAEADFKAGTATVTTTIEHSMDEYKEVIEQAGYVLC